MIYVRIFLPTCLAFYYFLFLLVVLFDHSTRARARAHTNTHTHSRSPLDEGSARSRNLCRITHNTQKRQTSIPPLGFKPAIPEGERSPYLAWPPGSAV